MPELRLTEIAQALKGTVIAKKSDGRPSTSFNPSTLIIRHYHFDTRLIDQPDTLFFALKNDAPGGRDGHCFLTQLEDKPGIAAVVSKDFDHSQLTMPLIQVEDPLKAAQDLARYVRQKHHSTSYIGVTGSAGKTTTKEFIYQIVSRKFKAYRSFKNWNNWIGMPFSILNLEGDEDAAVFELAMSYPGIGEINLLADILRPNIAVILNVYPVHLEFLKTVENAAKAKSEILDYLKTDDVAFINGDNRPIMERLEQLKNTEGKRFTFGKDKQNPRLDILFKEVQREGEQTGIVIRRDGIDSRFVTHLVNGTQIENLSIAILVARQMGMKDHEIQEALHHMTPLQGRGNIYRHDGFTIIDETYNSNPEALKRTLQWVAQEYSGHKTAVVGDMLELGDQEDRYHKEVGHYYTQLPFNRLVTVGKKGRKIAEGALESGANPAEVHQFDNAADAGIYLREHSTPNSILLFKASRGIQLEKAIQEFKHE